jgi:hypothetical protein
VTVPASDPQSVIAALEAGAELADVDRRLLVAFAVGLDALQDR